MIASDAGNSAVGLQTNEPAEPGHPKPALAVAGEAGVHAESSVSAWWSQSLALTGRQLLVFVRDVPTLLQSLIVPALSMLMFKVVLGDAIGRATGQDSAYGTVPLVILVGAMFGSIASATRLNRERSTGLLARLYVLPINRGADLTSRVASDLVRVLVTTLLLLAAGHLIGFRFTQGVGPAIGLVAVALAYGAAFGIMTLALAVNAAPGAPIVPYLGLFSSLLMFFNSGFSPLSAYPEWLQPIVANQPMTPAIDLMRAFAVGGPIAENLLKVGIWTVALLALSIYPALRGYRKAATAR
ncbi:ABC transporter permease [Gordonia amicalis]|uniref:ABC transporter permease n=1 Tax=Gordonia amicalis TaxID=89053 RepID=UPI0002A64C0A|nr:ABC transporter permease [Gordonia amicalis]MDV7101915.1 ABC transporter permease [Gordonia amicalis]MDV7173957.1 ABC transporter permease [Gordonia amicalis]UKO91577.1 ABC transporter permease [Gordonia amicalis]GAC51651.1 putative ABC transporter permease protein [Gordonia amicalis NBRC 100051 = JCM 11271]